MWKLARTANTPGFYLDQSFSDPYTSTMASSTTHEFNAPLHFLLFPLPAQGHLNPMLAFAENLLAEGCNVTCVLSEDLHRAMLDAGGQPLPGLLFVTFPSSGEERSVALLEAMQQQQGFLEDLIERGRSSDAPFSCIISDFVFPWALDVANKCGIPCALFWTCSAALLHIIRVTEEGAIHPEDPRLQALERELHVSVRIMLDFIYIKQTKHRNNLCDRFDEASHVLINTFDALESSLVPLLLPNTRFIGPCLPKSASKPNMMIEGEDGDKKHPIAAGRFGSLTKEDMTSISWLDKQKDHSVLFISFGSLASPQQAQIEEIALGLEASTHTFLWVARQNPQIASSNYSFPDGFLERTRERGLVIPWAPQLQVLKHRAIGGFFTHCGWNSILESISMGVPMLCFPIIADQPINAEIITTGTHGCDDKHGKPIKVCIGLGFEGCRIAGVNSDYVVPKEEVEKAVRTLLASPHDLRENAKQLMHHARVALDPHSGSSHVALCSFIQDIHNLRHPQ